MHRVVRSALLSQNTDSSANRKIVRDLKKSDTESNPIILCTGRQSNIDKILLSQNEEHFNSIVESSDRGCKIDNAWLEKNVAVLYNVLNEKEEECVVGHRINSSPNMDV
jgi:hypothetical protein